MRKPTSLALALALVTVSFALPSAQPEGASLPSPGGNWHAGGTAAASSLIANRPSIAQFPPDIYEPDDTPDQANPLGFDEFQQRSLHDPRDSDWVTLSLTAGDRILLFTTGNCDTYLYLYAPDGLTIITEDDDSGGAPNAAIRYTVEEDGVYYGRVRLFGASPLPCPSYQLGLVRLPPLAPDAFEPDDSPVLATPVTLDGTPQSRSIHVGGDRDWVSISVQGPIGIIIATGGECDMFLTLYDRDATTVLATDDDSGSNQNALIMYTLRESGTYFVEIRHFDATDGTCDEYLFGGITQEPSLPDAYEPDNNPAQAKPLPLDGTTQQRSFHVPDDDDWVSFPATAGDRIFLATEGPCDTFISVFAPDRRTILREDDDAGGELNAALLFTAQETGTHYARVRAFAGTLRACPSYRLYGVLVLKGGPTPAPVTPVTPVAPETATPVRTVTPTATTTPPTMPPTPRTATPTVPQPSPTRR